MSKSRWANWSKGTERALMPDDFIQLVKPKKEVFEEEVSSPSFFGANSFAQFLEAAETPSGKLDTGNPTSGAAGIRPSQRAKQLGLVSDGHGSYLDPSTQQIVARTVNGELVFYDNGASGGVVSDGGGGEQLTQAQPSWVDPASGLIIVPPAQPETDVERNIVVPPTPATAPKGYDDFISDAKRAAGDEAQLAMDQQAAAEEKAQKLELVPILDEFYKLPPRDPDPLYDATLEYIEQNFDEVFEQMSTVEDRFQPEVFDGIQNIANCDVIRADAQNKFLQLQDTQEFNSMGKDEKALVMDQFDAQLEEIESRKNNMKSSHDSKVSDLQTIMKMNTEYAKISADPNYDLDQSGKVLGNGKYGTVYDIGDGTVIKNGYINRSEVQIMNSLFKTGLVPKVINARTDTIWDNTVGAWGGKIAMTKSPGLPISAAVKSMTPEALDIAESKYLVGLSKMHKRGVSHNDLHTRNIMSTEDGSVVSVLDFGKAKRGYHRAYMEGVNGIELSQSSPLSKIFGESKNDVRDQLRYNLRMKVLPMFYQYIDSLPKEEQQQMYDSELLDYLGNGLDYLYSMDELEEIRDGQQEQYSDGENIESPPGEELLWNIPEDVFEDAIQLLYDEVED